MHRHVIPEADKMVKRNARRRGWRKFVRVMACIVVFCTTYALILPAITMEWNAVCGLEEHTHADACYEQVATVQTTKLVCTYDTLGVHVHTQGCYGGENEPQCGYADFVVHSHDGSCVDETGTLVCTLPQVRIHEHTLEDCYRLVEAEPAETGAAEIHTHEDACYRLEQGELTCELEETEGHTHGEDCFTVSEEPSCGLEESEEHTHEDSCYGKILTCEQTVIEAHQHTDACYEQNKVLTCELEEGIQSTEATEAAEPEYVLVCTRDEIILHTHDANCFDKDGNLICGKIMVERHVHGQGCFVTEETEADPEALSCTLEEDENHSHGALCYGQWTLSCTMQEHTHDDSCYEAEEATESEATEAEETEPDATESEVTEPDATEAEATEPGTAETEADTTEPDATEATEDETQNVTEPGALTGDVSVEGDIALMGLAPTEYYVEPKTIEGTELTWAIIHNASGGYTLVVDGTGEIPASTTDNPSPWLPYKNTTMELVLGEGITKVGADAFGMMRFSAIDLGGVQEIGARGFTHVYELTSVSIPETVKIIGADAFQYCAHLKTIELCEGVETIGSGAFKTWGYSGTGHDIYIPSTVTSIGGLAFMYAREYTVAENNAHYCAVDGVLFSKDMKTLADYPGYRETDEYRIPEGVKVANGLSQVKKTKRLYVPSGVVLPGRDFEGSSGFEEIYMEDGVSLGNTGLMFYGANNLRYIRFPENTKISIVNAFYNGSYTELESFKIPNGTTYYDPSSTSARFPFLEEFIFDAEDCSFNLADSVPASGFELVIGRSVNNLQSGFTILAKAAGSVRFEGGNAFTVQEGAFDGAPAPLQGISGTLYVDAQGVLYSYDAETATAKVICCPSNLTEITIPATIAPEENVSCTVTAIGQDALKPAEILQSITFETPEAITSVEAHAMANCPSLTSVNGKTTVEEAAASFNGESVVIGYEPFYNTGLLGASGPGSFSQEMDGQEDLAVSREDATPMSISVSSQESTLEWVAGENGIGGYRLLTNESLVITAAVGNVDATTNIYRVYMRATRADCSFGITPGGEYTLGDGIPVKFCTTEDPYTFYMEFVPPAGGTKGISTTAVYLSPTSPGGGLTIWGVILTEAQAAEQANKILAPETGETVQAYWTTAPDEFRLEKTSTGADKGIVSDGAGGAKPADSLTWQITLSRVTEESENYGKDYVKSVDYTDVLTFPDGISWAPEVLEAVQNGKCNRNGNTLYAGDIAVVTLSNSGGGLLRSPRLVWDGEQEKIAIRWNVSNSNDEAEIGNSMLTLSILPDAVSVDMTVFTGEKAIITNDVSAVVHYHYSEDAALEAHAEKIISGGEGKINLSKTSIDSGVRFGESVTYLLDVYNDGGLPYVKTNGVYTLKDEMSQYSYITPENMEKMFAECSDLSIEITDATLGQWIRVTGTDGTDAWKNPGNTAMGESGRTLTVTYDGESYTATVTDGESYQASTAAGALRLAGYGVTADAVYTCYWPLNAEGENLVLDQDQHITYTVYATYKDTFQLMVDMDWPTQYPTGNALRVTNMAYVITPGGGQAAYGGVSNNIRREAIIEKYVLKNGDYLGGSYAVNHGDVLDYRLDFTHYGYGTYENLPMVDDLYGSQYLLAPVEKNPHLASKGLREHEGSYVLTEGSYTDVVVGTDDTGADLTAASVTVQQAGEDEVQISLGGQTHTYTGVHTQIKWYFPDLPGEDYLLTVSYQALVDMESSGMTYTIGNVVWMNDKPGSRIYATLWGGGTIIDFEKHIVTERGSSPSMDTVTDYSLVGPGESVTYRLTLRNTNNGAFYLNGTRLADLLPEAYGQFQWEKNINVTLLDVKTFGEGITCTGMEDWYIGSEYGGLLGETDQFMLWPETSSVQFTQAGTVYLYIMLTYPDNDDADSWNRYASAAAGTPLENTLYVYRFPSTVSHDLKETGNVLIQKGVYGMYHYSENNGGYYSKAGHSRQFYNNRDSRKRAIVYYFTLYNGGNKRLYLSDIQDVLPDGFTFLSLAVDGNIESVARNSPNKSIVAKGGYTPFGSYALVDINPGSVLYRSATVTASTTETGVNFALSNGSGGNLPLDEERGMYYLNKGEAVAFAYICDIGDSTETEDSATNVVAMPYYDYLDTGVVMLDSSAVSVAAHGQNSDSFRMSQSPAAALFRVLRRKPSAIPIS